MTDTMVLTVSGQRYEGWTAIRFSRAIDRMCSEFEVSVTERWAGLLLDGRPLTWRIRKFDPCTLSIDSVADGPAVIFTGYVDEVEPTISADSHQVRITGRSRTQDLVDCQPDLPSGQFKGYTLAPICRAIAALFDIAVVAEVDPDTRLSDTMMERCETAYEFLERLGRLSGTLLTDDEYGRLVLSRTGTQRSPDHLLMGANVKKAAAKLSGKRQFSRYVVKGQHALHPSESISADADGGVEEHDSWSDEAPAATAAVQVAQEAVALDPSVPRFRQRVVMAESQLDQAGMQARVRWMATYAAGRSTQAQLTVVGWRQSDGTVWRINRLAAVTVPQFEIDHDLLIVGVQFALDDSGQTTVLTVAPPEGYTPDPGQVKLRKAGKHGHKGGSDASWSGAGGITTPAQQSIAGSNAARRDASSAQPATRAASPTFSRLEPST